MRIAKRMTDGLQYRVVHKIYTLPKHGSNFEHLGHIGNIPIWTFLRHRQDILWRYADARWVERLSKERHTMNLKGICS